MIFRKRQSAVRLPQIGLVIEVRLRSDLHYLTLRYVDPVEYTKRFRGAPIGRPTHYTIVGRMLWIGPKPDKRYDVLVKFFPQPKEI